MISAKEESVDSPAADPPECTEEAAEYVREPEPSVGSESSGSCGLWWLWLWLPRLWCFLDLKEFFLVVFWLDVVSNVYVGAAEVVIAEDEVELVSARLG